MKILQNIGGAISAHFQPGRLVHATLSAVAVVATLGYLCLATLIGAAWPLWAILLVWL